GALRDHHSPWWAPPQTLDERGAAMLASLCALSAVAVYPGFLLSQLMPFAREEMGFSRTSESVAFASIRADFLVALFIVGLADRRGRRRLTVLAIVAGSVSTAVGAAAPNLAFLAATQVVS